MESRWYIKGGLSGYTNGFITGGREIKEREETKSSECVDMVRGEHKEGEA